MHCSSTGSQGTVVHCCSSTGSQGTVVYCSSTGSQGAI